MERSIADIAPVLYGLHYIHRSRSYLRLDAEKSHYVYRFLCLCDGEIDASIGGRRVSLRAGELLYLLPGESYRLFPHDRDFLLYNIFFDFFPCEMAEARGDRSACCVFLPGYERRFCSPRVSFTDAPIFNQSRVFGVDCRDIFEPLLAADRADPLYRFCAAAALTFAVTRILQSERRRAHQASGADPILSYIRLNPEGDLSPAALSARFSYHKNYINHLVRSATGIPLGAYVRRIRMNYAKTLLLESGMPPAQVAAMLGYYDYSHFYKAFSAENGMSPTAYLKHLSAGAKASSH